MLAKLGKTFVAMILVPILWPGTFIAIWYLFPEAIDPLLSGIQGVLYVAGVVWILLAIGVTLVLSVIFRIRRTVIYFVVVATLLTVVAFTTYMTVGLFSQLALLDNPAVIYPDSRDDILNLNAFVEIFRGTLFVGIVALATTIIFAFVGGLSAWKQVERPLS